MITRRKVVLVANNTYEGEFWKEFNFEAIKIITDAEEIENVWRCNKTPLMLKKDVTAEVEWKYPVVDLPDFISGQEDFIIFCHKNGFECGEYIHGKKFNTAKDKCFLCGIAGYIGIKGPLEVFNATVKQINDMIIYESENFFVKIELGCMKKGMLMICPKLHVLSAACIPDEHFDEYLQVMRDVEFMLKAIYGDESVIFFEHGSAPSGFSSHQRSIVHAHTHVAWGVKFPQKYLEMVCLKPVNDVRVSKASKYFSYQEGTEGQLMLVNDPDVYVQRQYPRQVIGEILGIENEKTNWRKEAFMENMIETFNDFYHYLKKNASFLSERILMATEGFVKGYPRREDFRE